MKKRDFVKALALGLGLLLAVTGCSAEGQAPELLEPAKVQADIETPSRGEIFNIVMYEASVTPDVEGNAFSASGEVKKLYVTLGDVVEKGDILGVIDMTEVQTQRDELAKEMEVMAAEQDFSQRRMELEVELLEAQGQSAQAQLKKLEKQESADMYAVEYADLQQQLESLDRQLEGDTLRASCGGTVVKMDVSPGGQVRAGSTVIYIAKDDTMLITTEYITQTDIDKCDRVYASIGGQQFDVEYIPYERSEYLAIAVSGGELHSSFSIKEPSDQISNGMFTCVYLVTDYVQDALKVPANAVHKDSGGSYVYLAQDDQQVKQYVTLGVETEAEVQILDGLEEGDSFYVQS